MSLKLPDFESESQEAEWWYEHRAEVEADFLLAAADGRLKRRTPAGEFVAEPPHQIAPEDLADAREVLERSGIWLDDDTSPVLKESPQSGKLLATR